MSTEVPIPVPRVPHVSPNRATISTPGARHGITRSEKFLFAFVAALLGAQVALYFLGGTPLRLPLRIGVYAASLVLCVIIRDPSRYGHPALRVVRWIPAILAISLLHPARSTITAGFAQMCLYIAVLGPLFWVSRIQVDSRAFRILLLAIWALQTASACLGVLQVKYPGQFLGSVAAVTAANDNFQHGALTIVLANGVKMIRPMGLTDTVGGAAFAGLYAIVLGLGLFFTDKSRIIRVLTVGGMLVGLFCLLLCQTRVLMVMSVICVVAFGIAMIRRGDWARVTTLSVLLLAVGAGGGVWAIAVGGDNMLDRLQTLTADDPGTVFQQNRGGFIQRLVTDDIPMYPFGAGPGRWGMMNYYFGDPTNALWSEVMWTSWLYDGGLPLLLTYSAAIAMAIWTAWKIATNRINGRLAAWGAMVFSYDMAAVAATFVFPLFSVQTGMEVWLLNACLWAVWQKEVLQEESPAPLLIRKRSRLPSRPLTPPAVCAPI